MTRLNSFVVAAVGILTFSACGSDEGGGKGTGGSTGTTGGSTGTTGGSGNGTNTGGAATTGGANSGQGGGATTGGSTANTGGGKATGGTATGGSGGANSCQVACQKLVGANCGDITAAACANGCQPPATCASESEAYFACIGSKGTVSCNAMMMSQVAGCDTEGRALNICGACDPVPNDTPCGMCTRATCCTQVKAYNSASDVQGFDTCISAATCTTQACVDQCATMYPVAGKAYNDAVDCQASSCSTPCICAAAPMDEACDTCVKTSCCDGFVSYVNAPDFPAFSTCLQPCMDLACLDACVAQSPMAGAAYNALITNCVDTTCATECAAP